jgi:hypothetical protein
VLVDRINRIEMSLQPSHHLGKIIVQVFGCDDSSMLTASGLPQHVKPPKIDCIESVDRSAFGRGEYELVMI